MGSSSGRDVTSPLLPDSLWRAFSLSFDDEEGIQMKGTSNITSNTLFSKSWI